MSEQKYYRLHDIMRRNSIYNFVVGHRSGGKTLAFKEWAVDDWINHKKQFILLRRHESELMTKNEFFSDIYELKDNEGKVKFENYEFKINGYHAYIREKTAQEYDLDTGKELPKNKWECFGFILALSTQQNLKGSSFHNVNKILFDEFIKEEGYTDYLPNEVEKFNSFYLTVDRLKMTTRVFFMANAASIMNPYFISCGITIKDMRARRFNFRNNKTWTIEYYVNELAQAEMVQKIGDLFGNTTYVDYAADNTFRDAHNKFICDLPENRDYYYTIIFCETRFTIFTSKTEFKWFITNKRFNYVDSVFCLTTDDMQPNIMMIDKSSDLLKALRRLFQNNQVYFDTISCRQQFLEMLGLLNMR